MNHLIQPNRWSCTATAWAMALGISVEEMIRRIGHDGSDIVCPAEEPGCRRGFHSQECVAVASRMGFAVTYIELFPANLYPGDHKKVIAFPADAKTFDGNWERFRSYIDTSRGVIAGRNRKQGHAVAFDNGAIYDPDGSFYFFSQTAAEERHFFSHSLWRLDRICENGI